MNLQEKCIWDFVRRRSSFQQIFYWIQLATWKGVSELVAPSYYSHVCAREKRDVEKHWSLSALLSPSCSWVCFLKWRTVNPCLVDLLCMVKCAPPNLSWKQSTCTELRVLKELCRQGSVGVNCEEMFSTGVWLSASTCSGCLPCRDLLSLKCPIPGSGPSCLSRGAVGWSCQEDCIRPVRRLLARDFPWREGQTEEIQRCKRCHRMVSLGVRGRGFPPEQSMRLSWREREVGRARL